MTARRRHREQRWPADYRPSYHPSYRPSIGSLLLSTRQSLLYVRAAAVTNRRRAHRSAASPPLYSAAGVPAGLILIGVVAMMMKGKGSGKVAPKGVPVRRCISIPRSLGYSPVLTHRIPVLTLTTVLTLTAALTLTAIAQSSRDRDPRSQA